jgi:hypothetical protein
LRVAHEDANATGYGIINIGDNMKEIKRLYVVDEIEQERLDAVYQEGDTLSFRSKNSGQIVMTTYNSYYCEAVYSLDQANTQKFLASLDSDFETLADVLETRFVSPAGLDRIKRHLDQHQIHYDYEFIID